MTGDRHALRPVTGAEDWRAYHDLRRRVLFEARGRVGVYREDHPDERAAGNRPFLLTFYGAAIGTLRLDALPAGRMALRLVCVDPTRQGRGHGARLLALAQRAALYAGATQLVVNAAPEAVGFYAGAGFQPGRWSDPAGSAGNSVQMIKSLACDARRP